MGILSPHSHNRCKCGCHRTVEKTAIKKTKFKIGLYGPAKVGKSSIRKRLVDNTFDVDYVNSKTCEMPEIKKEIKGEEYSFKIFDTPGEEKYNSLLKLFLRLTDYFILVFAINNKKSFLEMKERFTKDMQFYQEAKNFILIGNKTDQSDSTEVSNDEAKEFAKEINATYMTMSCLKNEGIEEMMEFIIKDIISKDEKIYI